MRSVTSDLVELLERKRIPRDAALAGLNHAVPYDFVLLRESDVDRTARAQSDALHVPTMYQLTGTGTDKLFIGDVLGAGPEAMGLGPYSASIVGKTVLLNEQNLSYRLTERGDKRYLIRALMIAATLDRETFAVQPIHDQMLVKFDPEDQPRALQHQRGDGTIWLPTDDLNTDDVSRARPGHRGMTACYGVVVANGPGCHRDGQWSQAPVRAGDLIMYDSSFGSLPITIKGKGYTLVPARNLVHIADRAPA